MAGYQFELENDGLGDLFILIAVVATLCSTVYHHSKIISFP
jgi:hypothetical protein